MNAVEQAARTIVAEPYAVCCRECHHQHARCTCTNGPVVNDLYIEPCMRLQDLRVPINVARGSFELLSNEQLADHAADISAEVRRRYDERTTIEDILNATS